MRDADDPDTLSIRQFALAPFRHWRAIGHMYFIAYILACALPIVVLTLPALDGLRARWLSVAPILVVLFLIERRARRVDAALRENGRSCTCPQCLFDLRATRWDDPCPECGRPHDPARTEHYWHEAGLPRLRRFARNPE